MISMQGVPSALILRNESWVRQQARSLARRLPANVERADLIQAGLIAVAQAAISFQWDGDRDSEQAQAAFASYARHRVRGAMIDELRQMDHLTREQRRRLKVVQLARERWHAQSDAGPTASDLGALSGLTVEQVLEAESYARIVPAPGHSDDDDTEAHAPPYEPATEHDEVEARVDTGILLRRLESFFATLPERDRQVIDAYLGVGLSPADLAKSLNVSRSRLSQLFRSVCDRIGLHLGTVPKRATDRAHGDRFETLMARREDELDHATVGSAWPRHLQAVLERPAPAPGTEPYLVVTDTTRWG